MAPAKVTQIAVSEPDFGPGARFPKPSAHSIVLCALPPRAQEGVRALGAPRTPRGSPGRINRRLPDSPQPRAGSSLSGVGAAVGRGTGHLPGLAASQAPEPPGLRAACATAACATALLSRRAGRQAPCSRPSRRQKTQLGPHSRQAPSPRCLGRGLKGQRPCARTSRLHPRECTGHCQEGEGHALHDPAGDLPLLLQS